MPENSEIKREQTHVSRVYERLDSLREETRSKLSTVRASKVGGNHQNRSERDAFATMYEDQLLRLREAETGLCFGRLDMADDKTTYIGRIGISDSDQTQLLMDWRAPASEPFYRATAANPVGVVRRRHIATRGRTVIGLEDDVLDLEALTAAYAPNEALPDALAVLAWLEWVRGRLSFSDYYASAALHLDSEHSLARLQAAAAEQAVLPGWLRHGRFDEVDWV